MPRVLKSEQADVVASKAYRPDDDCLTVSMRCQGAWTKAKRNVLVRRLDRCIEEHDPRVVAFDVAGHDEAAIGLLSLYVRLRLRGLEVRVLNASANVVDKFKRTYLCDILNVQPAPPAERCVASVVGRQQAVDLNR